MAKKQLDPTVSIPVSGEQLANEFDVGTVRRIQQLVQEGLPQIKRNAYDLLECFRWFVRYQRRTTRRDAVEAAAMASPMGGLRERLMRTQVEREEMDLLKVRGMLVPLAAYEQNLTALVIAARTRLLQLPSRLAALIVSLEDPTDRAQVKRLIDDEIRATLEQLGRGSDDGSAIPGDASQRRGVEPSSPASLARAAAPTDIRVGEGEPHNSRRGQ